MSTYSVTFSELDTLLQSLSANTKSTFYDIEVTDATNTQCTGNFSTATEGTLQYILQQNSTKYIKLHIPTVTKIGKYAFKNCNTLVQIDINNNISSIDNDAFRFCENLEFLEMPFSVRYIGSDLCNGCTSLERIIFPDDLLSINDYTCRNCTNLQYVQFGSSIRDIGSYSFKNCTSLETIKFCHNYKQLRFTYIGLYFNEDCPNLRTVHIYDQATKAKFIEEYETEFGLTGITYVIDHETNDLDSSNIGSAISGLANNTPSTAYKTEIEEVTQNFLAGGDTAQEGTLQYILQQNPNKYIAIENDSSDYSDIITSMQKSFKNCTNIVSFKGIPSTVTNMTECFKGCTNLTEVE